MASSQWLEAYLGAAQLFTGNTPAAMLFGT